MSPTSLGLWLLFGYPPAILAYDAFIKFVLGDTTISEYVWTHKRLRIVVCVYLAFWAVLLIAHLGWMFLPG